MADPQWKGLFEWSMKHNDGTRVSDFSGVEVDPAKMAWLQEVLSNYVKDLTQRLKEIKKTLEEPENHECSLREQEALLDELKEIVEDLDQAKNLHLIGGLPVLLELLASPHDSIKWRAAEVAAACVQNHSEVQSVFLENGALQLVLSVAGSDDAACQLKGWMAVSCLVRNHPTALESFNQLGGFEHLIRAMHTEDVRLKRRVLFLMEHVLSQHYPVHLPTLQKKGSLGMIIRLITHEDLDVREKALGVLVTVCSTSDGMTICKGERLFGEKFQEALSEIAQLGHADIETRQTEIELLRQIEQLAEGN